MIQPELNKDFNPIQIADFILDNDKLGLFMSARYHKEDFVNAIEQMNQVHQVITWKNDKEIWGTLGWIFVTEENKHMVGKQIWRLPENIVDGEILYLSFIATKGNCDVLAAKKMFEEMGYRKRITKRRGFTKNGWYEKIIARPEVSCVVNH